MFSKEELEFIEKEMNCIIEFSLGMLVKGDDEKTATRLRNG